MDIRSFQPGDEFEQLSIYNTAAAALPKFKPAVILDIQRRVSSRDFDPTTRLYAVEKDKVVGYCTWAHNGRVGYPWCLPGHEAAAELLFAQALSAMKQHGVKKAFSAYRKDWPAITEFFVNRDFTLAREMINFVLRYEDMPTASARPGGIITDAAIDDIPAIFALDPSIFRVSSAQALQEALWQDPYFKPHSLFVLRGKDGTPTAAGIFITDAAFADPRKVDADMPCFRLGAFGTEGMTAKRIKGLFSFVARPERNVFSIGMDMLGHAISRLNDDDDIPCFAAQVASDAPALLAFYQQVFQRQGSFPVYERELQ